MVTMAAPPHTRRNTCRKCTVWSPVSSLECKSLCEVERGTGVKAGMGRWEGEGDER